MSSQKICVTLPRELLKAIDRIAEKEKRTRSALLREAAQLYAEDVRVRGVLQYLREWSDEEIAGWLKQDKNSKRLVQTIKKKRAG